MQAPKADSSWRDSARSPKLWIFDARASFPLLLMSFHITWGTFAFAILATMFFTMLNKYGFSLPVFYRYVKSNLAGPRKLSQPRWLK